MSTQISEIVPKLSFADIIQDVNTVHSNSKRTCSTYDTGTIRSEIESELFPHAQNHQRNEYVASRKQLYISDKEIASTIAKSRWHLINLAINDGVFKKLSFHGLWDIITLLQNRNDLNIPNLHELIERIHQRKQKQAWYVF